MSARLERKTAHEALSVATGLCSMNAPYARVYAFTEAEGGGVNIGEFLAYDEVRERLNSDHFDGFVQLHAHTKKPISCVRTLKEGRRYDWYDGEPKLCPQGDPEAML
jgi:hypothetical protein